MPVRARPGRAAHHIAAPQVQVGDLPHLLGQRLLRVFSLLTCNTMLNLSMQPYGKRCCFIHTTVPGSHPLSTTDAFDVTVGPGTHRAMESGEPTSRLRNRMATSTNDRQPSFGPSVQSYIAPASGLPASLSSSGGSAPLDGRSRASSINSAGSNPNNGSEHPLHNMHNAGLKIDLSRSSTWGPAPTAQDPWAPTQAFNAPRNNMSAQATSTASLSSPSDAFSPMGRSNDPFLSSPYSATTSVHSKLFSPASATSMMSPWTPLSPADNVQSPASNVISPPFRPAPIGSKPAFAPSLSSSPSEFQHDGLRSQAKFLADLVQGDDDDFGAAHGHLPGPRGA
jgi:hypothetical protein